MTELPPGYAERAAAYLRGEVLSAPAADAATVALLRDGAQGLEVYLLRRVKAMSFAPGMHVFPGGGVDLRDAELPVGWSGPQPRDWAEALGCDTPRAQALVCAAVRETFEECGVLLAGPSAVEVISDTSDDSWESERTALVAHQLSIAELLARRSLMLRSDLLKPWAHWLTPEFEPRRYDTRFFVAALPGGQRSRDVGGESDHATWLPVSVALRRHEVGDLTMLPPTAATLRELSAYDAVAYVMSAKRQVVRRAPRAVLRDGKPSLVWDD